MKITICGGSGQLGQDCVKVLERAHDVVPLNSKEIDITDPVSVHEVIKRTEPNVVINCAAFTRVDDCETKKEIAWKVNAEGPKNLAVSSKQHDCLFIHISTDYVFDGKKNPPEAYVESDEVNPLSVYGRTKLEGELAVKKVSGRYIIMRTAWLYGFNGNNFLKTMLNLALKDPEREIRVVNDQFGSPTWSYSLAKQIEKLIEGSGQGVYHSTSEGFCTWFELAKRFLAKMDVPHNIIPCSTEESPTPAVRPANSILENYRLKESGLNIMKDWEGDLDLFVSLHRDALIEGRI